MEKEGFWVAIGVGLILLVSLLGLLFFGQGTFASFITGAVIGSSDLQELALEPAADILPSSDDFFITNAGNGSQCGGVNQSITLSTNIVLNGSCFIVNASNIVIDGFGYQILGNGSGIGVNITYFDNVTIKNLTIFNFTYGAYVQNGTNNTLSLLRIQNTTVGIYLRENADSNNLSSNRVVNNTINGTVVEGSNNNRIYDNYFANNTNHIWDNGTNTWNRTRYCDLTTFSSVQNVLGGACMGGNFFGNYTPLANTLDGLGRAEYPVPGGNNIDYLPLMYNATLGCRVITSNINLSVNYTPFTIVGTATSGLFGCLNISGANVIVDGGGTTIRQDRIGKTETSIGYGILLLQNHLVIKNFILDGFSFGGPLQVAYGGVNETITNITIKNLSSTAVDYAFSGYLNASNITDMTITNLSSQVYGLGLMHGARSKSNTFNNLNITNAYGGVVLLEVMNNTFDNLTIANIDKYYFYESQCDFSVAPLGLCRNAIINFRELEGEADIVIRYKTNTQVGTQGMYRYDFKHRVTVNVTNTSGTGLSGFLVEGKENSTLNTEASINTDDNGIATLTLTEFSVIGGFFLSLTPHVIVSQPKNYTTSYNISEVTSNLYVNLSLRLIGCAENMFGPRLSYGQSLFCPGQLLNISARYATTAPEILGSGFEFTNAHNATGIQMHGQHKVTIDQLTLFNFSTGMNISNTSSSTFQNFTFRNNTRALMFIDAQDNIILQGNLSGGGQDSVIETAYATSTFPTRNYFRNSTFNISNITVEGLAELTRQYFVTVNVTFNNGTALPAASVYAFANRTQEFETSGTTDRTGRTRLILMEVIKNVSGLIYKTPHNISFNFSTSQGVVSNSTVINLTETNSTLIHLSISLNCTAPKDGLLIDTDTTLCPGIYDITDEDGRGIILMNNNSHKLTCDSTKFIGSSSSGTVIAGTNKRNLTITGCYLEGHKYGISFNDVNESQINNTVIKNMASNGIRFIDSFHNTITRNQLRDSVGTNKYGFYFAGSANNSVYNNTFDYNTIHLYFDAGYTIESGNNTFYFNQFRNALSSDVFQVTPRDFENFFNKTVSYGDGTKNVGNLYDFICLRNFADSDNDGFYDRGEDYPYNHSGSRFTKSAAFAVDYAPIRIYNCSSPSSSSSSSAVGGGGEDSGGGSAAATAAQAEAAAAAGAVGVATAAEAASTLSASVSSGGGGLVLNLRNTGDKTIELTPQIVETPLENEQEIVDRLRGEGLADEEIKHRVNTYRVAEQQGLDTQLGRVASAFEEPVSDLEPSREFVEGEPLQIEVSLPEEITILPGETYESEVQITGGFGPERQVTLAFEVDNQVVNEQTATVGGSATAGAAINYDPDEQTLETYIFVPPNEGGEYWVESQVDTALPEEVVSAITAAAIGVAEKSTLVSDLYGPFRVEENESLFVGQQFLHGISYQGPAEVTIRIRKGNEVVTTQTFPVVFAKTTGYREGLSSWTFWGLVVFLIGVLMLPLAVQLLWKRSK